MSRGETDPLDVPLWPSWPTTGDCDSDARTSSRRSAAGKQDFRFRPDEKLCDRYRIERFLGRGGMGEVYLALDEPLEERVALKWSGPGRCASRLRAEVKTARRITHPNVCRVHDLYPLDDGSFITMEYVDGQSLRDLLAGPRRPLEPALELGIQIAEGLAAIHAAKVVHRDLKPANVLIDGDGVPKISDFGLAGTIEESRGAGFVEGTPAYMAPEILQGRDPSVRSDLFSLGRILQELFTGRRSRDRERSCDGQPDLPTSLERLVSSCQAEDPDARPESAEAIVDRLENVRLEAWRPGAGDPLLQRLHWKLESRLGRDAVGESWLAVHEETGERRLFRFCFGSEDLGELEREVDLYRIVRERLGERRDVYDLLDWNLDRPPYCVEACCSAKGDLARWTDMQGGLLPVPFVTRLEIVAQVAEALAALHSVGVVYGPVDPHRLLLAPARAGDPQQIRIQLAGFGKARATGSTGPDSDDASADREFRGDVYSLGVLLYRMAVRDLSKIPGPAWRDEIPDDVLAEDISAALHGSENGGVESAARIARRLRSLSARRREASFDRPRKSSPPRPARRRDRTWWTPDLVAAALHFLTTAISSLQAIRRRPATRWRDSRRSSPRNARGSQAQSASVRSVWHSPAPARSVWHSPAQTLDDISGSHGTPRHHPWLQMPRDVLRLLRPLFERIV